MGSLAGREAPDGVRPLSCVIHLETVLKPPKNYNLSCSISPEHSSRIRHTSDEVRIVSSLSRSRVKDEPMETSSRSSRDGRTRDKDRDRDRDHDRDRDRDRDR